MEGKPKVPALRVVCFRCNRVIVEGDAFAKVNHGVCTECRGWIVRMNRLEEQKGG